jgi:hypothetical protein
MTPEQARARARKIFEQQKQGQSIKINRDGTPAPAAEPATYGKKTVLHDRKGEFAFDLFERDSPEFRMDTLVRGTAHRYEVERKKLASAWNAIEIDPPGYGAIIRIPSRAPMRTAGPRPGRTHTRMGTCACGTRMTGRPSTRSPMSWPRRTCGSTSTRST